MLTTYSVKYFLKVDKVMFTLREYQVENVEYILL